MAELSEPSLWRSGRAWSILALGLGVRLTLLLLAGRIDLQSDEANYVQLALGLERFGVLLDCYRYHWPPGYPAFLRACLWLTDDGALTLARVIQVVCSLSIGASIMTLGAQLFSSRVGRLSGLLWALHLPLAAFTHLLWAESLFLALWMPATCLLLGAVRGEGKVGSTRLVTYGLLTGLALHLKEGPLVLALAQLVPLGWVLWSRHGASEAVRGTTLAALTIVVTLTPWSLRNAEVYGTRHFASTLGENFYNGLNSTHRNFDLIPVNTRRQREGRPVLEVRPPFRDPLGDKGPLPEWPRAEEIPHLPTRLAENMARGRTFALEQPGWIARSRIQKYADLLAPTSFFTRTFALGHYGGALRGMAWLLVPLAALLSASTILLGLVGLARCLPANALGVVGLLHAGFFLAAGTLVAMSRFRVPLTPWILVGVAALLVSNSPADRRRSLAAGVVGVLVLLLWWVGAPTTLGLLSDALHGPEVAQ